MRVKCVESVHMHKLHSQCSEDWYHFQVRKNTLLQEVLINCDPVLTKVTGNPFSTSVRWIGPRGIDHKTSVGSESVYLPDE